MKKTLRLLVFFAIIVGLWQAVAMAGIWPSYVFPSPKTTAEALRQGFADRTFIIGIAISMKRVLIGYTMSALGGILLGALIGASSWLEDTLGTCVSGLQSLPSLCWVPVAILWFGLSEKAIYFVTIAGSLLAVTMNVVTGIHNVPKIYVTAARNLGAHGIRMYLHVLLPASLPHILSGLKQGWALAWRSLISGEMIFLSLGLGQLLMMGRDLNDLSQVFAVMILITVIGYTVERFAFAPAEAQIRRRWGTA
jgi:NitT/TauT family transport system permease protein